MEAVKIATRSDEECITICGVGDKSVEDKVIEDENQQPARSRFVVNAIKTTLDDDQVLDLSGEEIPTSGDRDPEFIDRDPQFLDCDPNSVNRDPVIIDRDPRSRKLANNLDVVKDGDVLTYESEDGKPESTTYYHESGELFAEEVDHHMAVLPEIVSSTAEVTIDDIQVGDPGVLLTEDQEGLRQLIWKNRHLLISQGNALPPAARGAVCDIDVGGAKPIAQRVRPVAPKFREKLADLDQGVIIGQNYSTIDITMGITNRRHH